MINRLEKQIKIPVSACDNASKLSIQGLFSLFLDMASEHGEMIRLGMDDLAEKGLIWLVVKTKICIREMPKMLENVTLMTWPERPGVIRCNRCYKMLDGLRVLAEGKNEWAMLEVETGRPHKLIDAYPEELEHCNDIACAEPFAKVSDDFSQCEELLKYKVTSNDIDVSQHMNNVAYIRMVMGAFSCREIAEMNAGVIEAFYRAQCYEGEILSIRLRKNENAYEIGVVKEDGKTGAIVRIVSKD